MSDPGPPPDSDPADAPPTPPRHGGESQAPPKDTENSLAILSLILGIVGIVACQLTAPIALFLGWQYRKAAEARGVEPDPMALVGMILGAVGTVLFVMTLLTCGGLTLFYLLGVVVFVLLGA